MVAKHPPRVVDEPAPTAAKHPPERTTTTAKYPQGEPATTAVKHLPEKIRETLAAKHPQDER